MQQWKEKLNGVPDFSHGKEVRLKGLVGKKKKPLVCEHSTRGGVLVKIVKHRKQVDDTKPVGR